MTLTPREHEALVLLSRGLSRDAAAREMGVSPHTLKAHLQSAYARLGVGNVVDALTASGVLARAPECGWEARCTRPAGHRGHHGGFRGL